MGKLLDGVRARPGQLLKQGWSTTGGTGTAEVFFVKGLTKG